MQRGSKPGGFVATVRRTIRSRQLSYSTEKNYIHWIKRFIRYHGMKHPEKMGSDEVAEYLGYLADERSVSAATQNQALNALVFLYKHVIYKDLGKLPSFARIKRPRNIPVVLSRDEIQKTLDNLNGKYRLIVGLLYGSGLRLNECLTLRLKDIDFSNQQIIVRQSKGFKDRVTPLPKSLVADLNIQMGESSKLFRRDRGNKLAGVSLPPTRSLTHVGELLPYDSSRR